jgi:hypothetical protein
LNHDGVDEVIIGQRRWPTSAGDAAGGVWISSGFVAGSNAASPTRIDGVEAAGYFGNSFATIPDLDGDSMAELVVVAPQAGGGSELAPGAAYLFMGSTLTAGITAGAVMFASDADQIWTGLDGGSPAISVAPGHDLDEDGKGDVILSTIGYDYSLGGTTNPDAGAVWVIAGDSVSGSASTLDIDAAATLGITGSTANEQINLGQTVGDINGDGTPELAVHAEGSAVHIFYGPIDLSTTSRRIASSAPLTLESAAGGNIRLGQGIGDLDGDGRDDLTFVEAALGADPALLRVMYGR